MDIISYSKAKEALAEAKKVIAPEKTNFITIPNNLINKNEITVGKGVNSSTGELTDDYMRSVTDFIPFVNGMSYQSKDVERAFFYGETKNYISSSTSSSYNLVNPSVKFVRFVVLMTKWHTAQVNFGSTLSPYDEYKYSLKNNDQYPIFAKVDSDSIGNDELKDHSVTPNKTTFFSEPFNLIDTSKVLSGTSVDLSGNIIVDATRWLSDFVPIEYLETLSITFGDWRVAYYTDTKHFIQRSGITQSSLISVAINAKFMRISGTIAAQSTMLNRGGTLLPHEPFKTIIKSEYLPTNEAVDDTRIQAIETDIVSIKSIGVLEPSPPTLSFTTVETGYYIPQWLSEDGAVIWGHYGAKLLQSTDEWATKVQVGTTDFPLSIAGVRELGDGELLVSTQRDDATAVNAKVYKTVGYDKDNPSSCTYKEVLTSLSSQCNFNNQWGFSVYQNIITLSEYGLKGEQGARRVYLSTDHGETFNVIFDLHTQVVDGRPPLAIDSAHTHGACYDPYFNRIWVIVGDLPNTATYYSDDMGVTFNYVVDSEVVQYTGIIPLPDCVIFGSDRKPNGVHVYKRIDKATMPVIENLFILNNNPLITQIFEMPFKRDWNPKTPVYFCTTGENGENAVIMGLVDGRKAHLLFEASPSGDLSGDIFCAIGATAQGNIIASMNDSTNGFRTIKAVAPNWI